MSTIFALATAAGRAGIAVVRISGDDAFSVAERLTGKGVVPRRPSLRNLKSSSGEILDQALVLGFARGSSFTGEDVVELQCHGSPAAVDAICRELAGYPDLRLADSGEFTRRALANGCLDLAQVEGLADLLDAETEAQRKQAFRVMSGSLSGKVGDWRTKLIRAAALIEATIDFADEDVPVDVSPEVNGLLQQVAAELDVEIKGSFVAERIRSGFEVAIVGAPNVGKSTLLNYLAGREAAITSEIAGTTRDVIEVKMDLKGLAVTLLDTAGLRKTDDHIEGLGIERAVTRAKDADLRIFLKDAEGNIPEYVSPEAEDLVFQGKIDSADAGNLKGVSGVTGAGVDTLVASATEILSKRSALAQNAIRERHRLAMVSAKGSLARAMDILSDGMEISELAAMEINTATSSLNSLIGQVGVEDLLDEIFSSFCLGK